MSCDACINKRFKDETDGLSGEYWVEHLADGTPLLIRKLAETDRDRDLAFFNELGKGKPHFLFLASFSNLVEPHDQLMDINLHNRMAYLALAYEGNQLIEIGTARYGAYQGDAHCEFAVAVVDRWQQRGVAKALLQHLMDTATREGFSKISSMDSSGNEAMHGLAVSMGFTSKDDNQHGSQVFHEICFSTLDLNEQLGNLCTLMLGQHLGGEEVLWDLLFGQSTFIKEQKCAWLISSNKTWNQSFSSGRTSPSR
ncbi:GNAT family N-acetyltransferase [Pseudomonas sp. NPDC086251]|uniref:GNAT family N-acetyltransferase n=1 Tax=Pseudomonas sp. NPDC086251 TaxID=3364431 RepID=UPI0038368546